MKVRCSDLLGASAVIFPKHCFLRGFIFVGDTGQEPTLTLFDHASAGSGAEKGFAMVSDEMHTFFAWFGDEGLECVNGIYAKLSAETGDYIAYYSYS